MKAGQAIRITYCGRTVDGVVILASDNADSLMLAFEAVLGAPDGGAFLGTMPVLRDAAGVYRDLLFDHEVTIEPTAAEPSAGDADAVLRAQLVQMGEGEDLIERAHHVLQALTKPYAALTSFDALEASRVITLLVQMHSAELALLTELRSARPLLLYGDAWIKRIDDVVARASSLRKGAMQ